MPTAANAISPAYRLLALLLILLVIALRQPDLLIHPRFYDEEAGVYYAYALHHAWFDSLIQPHLGYFALLDNVTTLIAAKCVPIGAAPWITTYAALAFDTLPYVIVWYGQSPYWKTARGKAAASAIILFIGQPSEIWLNVISVQYYLCLAAFLILAEDWRGRSRFCLWAYGGILAMAGLTGVVTCFLAPLFLWRWRGEKSPAGLFATMVCIACVVQAAALAWVAQHGGFPGRFNHFSLALAANALVKNLLDALLPGVFFNDYLHMGLDILLPLLLMLAGALYYFARMFPVRSRILFIGAFFCIAIPSEITSLNGAGGGRYAYASSVVLMLMLQQIIHNYFRQPHYKQPWMAAVIVMAVGFYGGMYNYFFLNIYDRMDWSLQQKSAAFQLP